MGGRDGSSSTGNDSIDRMETFDDVNASASFTLFAWSAPTTCSIGGVTPNHNLERKQTKTYTSVVLLHNTHMLPLAIAMLFILIPAILWPTPFVICTLVPFKTPFRSNKAFHFFQDNHACESSNTPRLEIRL
eukprot:m.169778 g.169778  ORF g.169778 m.169778 type:complete len:132 (-) comp14507_c0_seq2:84-479(-)